MRERILVTGAAGMVGSHVVDALRAQGRETAATDRYDCDLRDAAATQRMFRALSPTHVFHPAACVYGIIGNMNNPGQSFLENIQINTNVIEAARIVGVEKITVMGTGCVYPYPPVKTPLSEEDIFMGRPHPSEAGYAHAKLAMLAMLEAYEQHFAWAYVVSCNLFGPRDKFDPVNGHVIPSLIKKFCNAARTGGDVTVWGDGSAKRDFIYIKDAARAIVTIMDKGRGPINLGTNNVLSIGEIIAMISNISGVGHDRIIWDHSKPNGVDYRGYDLTKLNLLGFTRDYPIELGLQETWDWFIRRIHHDGWNANS